MSIWKKTKKEPVQGTVYLLHFSEPVGTDRQQAQHYIGWTSREPEERLAEHLAGRGCPLVHHAARQGSVVVVRTWKGSRHLERKIKNRKNAPALCPCCGGTGALRLANYQTPIKP